MVTLYITTYVPANCNDDATHVAINGCQGHHQLEVDAELAGEHFRRHDRQEQLRAQQRDAQQIKPQLEQDEAHDPLPMPLPSGIGRHARTKSSQIHYHSLIFSTG